MVYHGLQRFQSAGIAVFTGETDWDPGYGACSRPLLQHPEFPPFGLSKALRAGILHVVEGHG